MIVVDASALLEFLLQTPLGTRVEARLLRDEGEFHSPHLIDVEVAQALRRLVRAGEVSANRAAEAIEDLIDLDLHRHAHLDFSDSSLEATRERDGVRRDVRRSGGGA